jgi:prepilin signal peptidase PulO-like enzyme (type II secretory pathway)
MRMNAFLILPIVTGWIAGWIVNYLADVLPVTRRFSPPTCPHCNTRFTWMNYLLFQPCENGHTRSTRTWLVPPVMAALSAFAWIQPPPKFGEAGYWLGIAVLLYFGVVFVIDMEHRLILHPTSIVGAALGLVVGFVSFGFLTTVLGGLAGGGILLVLYYFGVLFTRIRAKRLQAQGYEADEEEALGFGDVILSAILGFMLGWPLIWFGLLMAILLAGIVGGIMVVFMLVIRRYKENALMVFMPYGPFLILSAFLLMFLPGVISAILPK